MSHPVQSRWTDIAPGFAGFLTLPPAGRGPGLVLFQEIFGVNAHIRALAEQYALDGFVVLAPDVFWRVAPRVELGYDDAQRDRGRALMAALQPADVLADIRSSVAALRALPECSAKAGAIGYCLGGRLAYLAAATTDVDAAVAYYGGGIHGQLDRAAQVRCPIQFHYAEHDEHIPPAATKASRTCCTAAGDQARVFVYAGAHHGFNCWDRGSYHVPSAALAHGRSLQWLAGSLMDAA
jgi:carboxymethylenebutenolidase